MSRSCHVRPSIQAGHYVIPLTSYTGWRNREPRKVESVDYDEFSNKYTLKIWNPQKDGYSNFNPNNFTLAGEQPMAEPKKPLFFALPVTSILEGSELLFTGGAVEMFPTVEDVVEEVRRHITKEGEVYVICRAISVIESEPPRPPIKVTSL